MISHHARIIDNMQENGLVVPYFSQWQIIIIINDACGYKSCLVSWKEKLVDLADFIYRNIGHTLAINSIIWSMCLVTRGSQVGGKHWSSAISRRNSLINRLLKLVTVSPASLALLIIWTTKACFEVITAKIANVKSTKASEQKAFTVPCKF
jgi:hypothetical protein